MKIFYTDFCPRCHKPLNHKSPNHTDGGSYICGDERNFHYMYYKNIKRPDASYSIILIPGYRFYCDFEKMRIYRYSETREIDLLFTVWEKGGFNINWDDLSKTINRIKTLTVFS